MISYYRLKFSPDHTAATFTITEKDLIDLPKRQSIEPLVINLEEGTGKD